MPDFGPSGQDLFDSLHDESDPASLTVLEVEAARIVDRLDHLAALLDGDIDCWARLADARDDVIEVRVDNALVEARQQASTLVRILAEINRRKGKTTGGAEDDPLDDL
ncbi:hypothetical protein C5E45_32945 [Nocardia nova]|uniref:Terminase small subunit n=1 Tax=Nocardia nova TaxID=37330 RepID=A0A2S6ACY7_9NOCA|nr:hypothetical protein [Nocardia nova]PPJ31900.1 hypothetical protein C5E45_32945 [Nocardia nova]